MNWSKRQAVSKAQEAIDNYHEQVDALTEEWAETSQNSELWKKELDEAHGSLADSWIGPGSDQRIEVVSAVVPQAKLGEVVANCAVELAANHERVAVIAEDPSYQGRQQLLSSDYPAKLKDIESRLDEVGSALNPFQIEEFRFALKEKLHLESKATGLRGFWETITGKARRKKGALARIQEVFAGEDLVALVDRFESLENKQKGIEGERESLLAAQKALVSLVEEYSTKSEMIEDYDEYRARAVKQVLKTGIEEMDLEALVSRVGSGLKMALAKCVALRKKVEYGVDLIGYLDREIEDRRKRAQSITGTKAKWRRYPKGSVPAKSKWLEQVPNMKREGTYKRTRWSRQNRDCLGYYADYDMIGNHLWNAHHHGRAFLAFDVFNYGTSYRMPYEGFTREVIPELAEYRDVHDQDGPPKEWLDEHSEDFVDEPGEGEEAEIPNEELPGDCEADVDADGVNQECDDSTIEDSEIDDPESGDAAAEAIADNLDSFEDAGSEDAS